MVVGIGIVAILGVLLAAFEVRQMWLPQVLAAIRPEPAVPPPPPPLNFRALQHISLFGKRETSKYNLIQLWLSNAFALRSFSFFYKLEQQQLIEIKRTIKTKNNGKN
jgi:hypothetical protein